MSFLSFFTNLFSSPLLGMGVGGIMTGMDSAAAYNQAQAQNLAAEWNANQMQQQAELSRIQAGRYREMGERNAQETLRKFRNLQGEQRVTYAASGVNVNTGSAAATQANTAAEGVAAANMDRYEMAVAAWEKDVEASNLEANAKFTKASKVQPWLPATSAALSGLTSIYQRYGIWQK